MLENVEILPPEAPLPKGLRDQQPLRPGSGRFHASRCCPSVRPGSLKDCAWSILCVSGFLWGELGAQTHGAPLELQLLQPSTRALAPMWKGCPETKGLGRLRNTAPFQEITCAPSFPPTLAQGGCPDMGNFGPCVESHGMARITCEFIGLNSSCISSIPVRKHFQLPFSMPKGIQALLPSSSAAQRDTEGSCAPRPPDPPT